MTEMEEYNYTPDNITALGQDEVFVFGSNLQGMHCGGAARTAVRLFGAIMGQGVGMQGQSYAIPTMQGGVESIKPYVDEFIDLAREWDQTTFYVTRIGCGIAGFTAHEIAPLFDKALDLYNIRLPKDFVEVILANRKRKASGNVSNHGTALMLAALVVSVSGMTAQAGGLTFTSVSGHDAVEVQAQASSGLSGVYVLYDASTSEATYKAASASAQLSCFWFDHRGAAYATEVDASELRRQGNELTITNVKSDCGYAITESGRTTYYWVADYSSHPFGVESLTPDSEQGCDMALLAAVGTAPAMGYYGINGRHFDIDREIRLTYSTLAADEANMRFNSIVHTENYASTGPTIMCPAPLCDTYFTLTGDRFLRQWGMEKEVHSPLFVTGAIDAIVNVTQHTRQVDNEVRVEQELGGSAPVDVTFSAAVSDAALFTQWQFASDADFNDITFRTPDTEFDYSFTQAGNTYVRFTAANSDGSCEYFSDTYTVYIGESSLLCPNAFTPGSSEGVNDMWKVSYKSIVSFECYIFNRWGDQLFESHDPAIGWDGKKGGKVVPSGVYYYVIKALGADGRKYNLSGDINILNSSAQ